MIYQWVYYVTILREVYIKIDNSPGFDVVNGALLVYRVSKPLENVDVEERLLVIIWGRERKIVKTHVYVVVADSNVGIVERKHDGCFVEIGLKRYVNSIKWFSLKKKKKRIEKLSKERDKDYEGNRCSRI